MSTPVSRPVLEALPVSRDQCRHFSQPQPVVSLPKSNLKRPISIPKSSADFSHESALRSAMPTDQPTETPLTQHPPPYYTSAVARGSLNIRRRTGRTQPPPPPSGVRPPGPQAKGAGAGVVSRVVAKIDQRAAGPVNAAASRQHRAATTECRACASMATSQTTRCTTATGADAARCQSARLVLCAPERPEPATTSQILAAPPGLAFQGADPLPLKTADHRRDHASRSRVLLRRWAATCGGLSGVMAAICARRRENYQRVMQIPARPGGSYRQ